MTLMQKPTDSALQPPSPEAYKAAMRGLMGAVSLITVGQGDQATGLIVSTGTSLTAEPPMILACVNRTSSSYGVLKDEGQFGFQVLGAAHEPLAQRFAGRTGVHGAARYDGADWITLPSGVRLLADAPIAFDCVVEDLIDKASHTIVIGLVRAIRTVPGQGALIYGHGAYHAIPD